MPANMDRDPRVDAYIAKAQPFAQPILKYLREVVHAGCPEVEEAIKWSCPHYIYKGMFCMMAGFKQHCAFGFWNAPMILAEMNRTGSQAHKAMGFFGRITSLDDLPPKRELIGYIKKAKELKDAGVTKRVATKAHGVDSAGKPVKPKPRPAPKAPAYLLAALKKNKKAQTTFAAFSPSAKREYIDWITEAKTEDTRDRRLSQAVEWMAEGKKRNWKYMKNVSQQRNWKYMKKVAGR